MNFRNYEQDNKIYEHYRNVRRKQTIDYVKNAKKQFSNFKHKKNVWTLIKELDNFIDISDPDVDIPNIHHLFQTAEGLRMDNHTDWLQLTGLLHDLGKILYKVNLPGMSLTEQWGIVGDTFILGHPLPKSAIYPELKFNSDISIYKENCGLSNCYISYGHDEFLYQSLVESNTSLPEEALYIIRFHSLYPWHSGKAYIELEDETDKKYKEQVQLFNKYDLYTKCDKRYSIDSFGNIENDELYKYYDTIINKYIPNGNICVF